jgi:hypothetical protein
MEKKKASKRPVCITCKEGTTVVGHMCNPKKDTPVYECQGCGIISTEKDFLCRPKLLKLK